MNYSNLTQRCMKSCERDAVITTGKPPSSSWLNLQSNQLPSTPLQLLSTVWEGEEIGAADYIILKLLQSKLLQCKDGGDGIYQFIVQEKVNYCCLSLAIYSAERSRATNVMLYKKNLQYLVITNNFDPYRPFISRHCVLSPPMCMCSTLSITASATFSLKLFGSIEKEILHHLSLIFSGFGAFSCHFLSRF